MEEKNPIQVADRLFLVLETLSEEGPTALADLSRMLELHKSTVHRSFKFAYFSRLCKPGSGNR